MVPWNLIFSQQKNKKNNVINLYNIILKPFSLRDAAKIVTMWLDAAAAAR